MAYEPLNLQNGQTLTAEDLQHMEQGIVTVLPTPKPYQQLVTDGMMNYTLADRVGYSVPAIGVSYEYGYSTVYDQITVQGMESPYTYYLIRRGAIPMSMFQAAVFYEFGMAGEGTPLTSRNYKSSTTFTVNGTYANIVLFDGVSSISLDDSSDEPEMVVPAAGLWLRSDDYDQLSANVSFDMSMPPYNSTIDPKFLPAIRGTAFYVNVTQTDTDTYTADKTYDEISNAITNGLIPYCVYGNYLLPLVCSDGGVLSGIAPASLVPYAHHFVAVVSTGSPICVRVDINTDNNVYIEKQGLQLS